MALRTFIALDIDDNIRERLAAACRQIDTAGAKIKWVDAEQLHVTLKFLGDIADDLISEVCQRIEDAAGQIEPFEFDMKGIIAVPPAGQLRMFWAGVHEASGRLEKLYEVLSLALAGLGLKEENREFKPHVTLGRVRFAKDPRRARHSAKRLGNEDFDLQHADEVVVYTSNLTPEGPVYTPVMTAALGV